MIIEQTHFALPEPDFIHQNLIRAQITFWSNSIDAITYHILQLQTQRAFLVVEQAKLQHYIDEIDESLHIISELFNGQPSPPTPPFPPCQGHP